MGPRASEPLSTRIGLLLVFGLGAGLLSLHMSHALSEGEDLVTFVYGILLPMLFSFGLLGGGIWLWRENFSGHSVFRIGAWCLIGGIALALSGGLIILYEEAEGVILSDAQFVIAGQASIGSVAGFVVGLYDVRQRQSRAHAEQVSNQLSVLNRVLRHDIRNEVNVIHGLINALGDDTGNPDHKTTIQRRAANLVELGDQARVMEDLFRQEEAPRDSIAIGPVFETLSDRLLETYPNVAIEQSIPDQATVKAHPLIESAFENVLLNAVDHNDTSNPKISIDCELLDDSNPRQVIVRVADNGPGIPDGEIDVLEQGYETPLEHMSGFGLWLVHWIVTKSDGDIWFEDNEPTGSIVCIQLDQGATTPVES